MKLSVLPALLALVFLPIQAKANESLNLADRTLLQATMQIDIDRLTVEGTYLAFDPIKGNLRTLYPAKNHPMIMRMGEHYILCSDFRDDKGKNVNIDFYLRRKGKSFVIFHKSIDQRYIVKAMMKKGVVTVAN
ncbi:MAG: hypothetical protein ACR2OW_15340 [Methyloligellaceae bacterium]